MTLAEQLIDEAHKYGIEVTTESLPLKKVHALYVNLGDKVLIMLNRPETQAEKACLLAEEIGHYKVCPCKTLRYGRQADVKIEARARRWGHERILSPEMIEYAYRVGARNRFEAAEYLGVTEEFLQEACDDYEDRGLL